MATPDCSAYLEEIKTLLSLAGENPFKIRAFDRASGAVAGRDDLLERARAGTLTEIEGIGKGIAEVLTAFLLHGTTAARDEVSATLPQGMLELSQISGVGPKKARQLVEELGVHSRSELEYACRENRLLKLKGFGPKLQQKILDSIQFEKTNSGLKRLGDVWPLSQEILAALAKVAGPKAQVAEVGALRRRMEVLSELEFAVSAPLGAKARSAIEAFESASPLPIRIHEVPQARWGTELVRLTGSKEHVAALGAGALQNYATETAVYESRGLPWIPPEARETGEELRIKKWELIECWEPRTPATEVTPAYRSLRGVFHNHTTRSDGSGTLEQMVATAAKLGFEYIGISDHSQTAFYAQGLKKDALEEQYEEIEAVREKHPEIKVFWGIESDILGDGSLDYDDKTLKRFDFVIASIHSRFQMDRAAMTERVLKAIRHPATRFVGHLTGRLLLGRPPFELDIEQVIAEAREHDVAIEINAHPSRLDIDWRWGSELRKRGTRVSIHPDAHSTEGLSDVRFGAWMARKAILPWTQIVNTGSAAEVERWLRRK